MTAISSTTAATATSSSATTANPYAAMGAGDFLSLLTTEMKNQDPTAPVDNTQMVADMAQFTNVANTSSMNSTLSTITSQLSAIGTALGVPVTTTGTTGTGTSTGTTTGTTTA